MKTSLPLSKETHRKIQAFKQKKADALFNKHVTKALFENRDEKGEGSAFDRIAKQTAQGDIFNSPKAVQSIRYKKNQSAIE